MHFSKMAIQFANVLTMGALLTCAGLAQKALAQKNVLVLHSYHTELSWTASLKVGIDQGFRNNEQEIQVFHEFLDAKRHPDLAHQQAFFDYLQAKYQTTDIDVVMVSDDPGLSILMQQRSAPFDTAPIVFLGINQIRPDIVDASGMTGVFENHSITDTIQEALRQTRANTLIVINDSTETGQANLGRLHEIEQLPNAPRVIVVNDIVVNEQASDTIAARFADYSEDWPVLIAGQLRNGTADGPLIPFEQGLEILRSQLPNPLYGSSAMFLGHGVVGGKVLNGKHHAIQAVNLANRILSGESVESIPPILKSDNHWMFDHRELKRFGIQPDNLPLNSELVHADLSFYEHYKTLVWGTSFGFLSTLLVIGLLIEVLRRRAAAAIILQENEQRYKDLAEAGADIFWEIDAELNLSHLSGKLPSRLSLSPQELLGKPYREIFIRLSEVDFESNYFESLIAARQPIKDFVFRLRESDNAVRIFKLNGRPIFDKQQQFLGYRGVQREITKEYNLAETLAYQATYDSLTGLINRNEFDTCLRAAVARAQQYGTASVLCYLDLDQFKIVNDTAGHLVGDQLLSELAHLLKQSVRPDDHLGRLGGDEFGLIIENCSVEHGQRICQTLIDKVLNYRFKWQDRQFNVGVSIGMVPINRAQTTATELLSRADLACYKAKDLGRGRSYVADGNDLELAMRQTQMARIANISQALEENRFFLMQQPIQSLTQLGGTPHVEILLRLIDEHGKVISPGHFIPIAERYGMIALIDRWVVETVIKQYDRLFPQAKPLVSINLSGASLSDNRFIEFVLKLIHQSTLDPHRLCFEITETAAISHLEQVKIFIKELKTIGVKFALDDFGSGVSSFGYLRSLPVDFLKIDGSLVRHIVDERCDRTIVDLVHQVAHMMGMRTIAEFVEDTDILTQLKKMKIDYAQGYAVGEPEPLTFGAYTEASITETSLTAIKSSADKTTLLAN